MKYLLRLLMLDIKNRTKKVLEDTENESQNVSKFRERCLDWGKTKVS